jgi:hypothetical protein
VPPRRIANTRESQQGRNHLLSFSVSLLGLVYGTERIRFWNVGGHAKLFWTLPCGPLVWTPFVAATIDQEFGYSHTLDIPVQTAAVADVFYYGSAQTFWVRKPALKAATVNRRGLRPTIGVQC